MKSHADERNQGHNSGALGRRLLGLISSLALALSVAAPAGVILAIAPAQPAAANAFGAQGELPIYGLALLGATAVDATGNVYVASKQSNLVLKLTPGGTQTTLPFRGLDQPFGVAVDSAGDVFVTNIGSNQVLELTAGGTQQTLPFTGLSTPSGVAVDAAGDVFVSSLGTNEVLELPAGSGTQQALGFTGLQTPTGIAVDAADDVFVSNAGTNQVLELPAGGGTQQTLAFTGLNAPYGVTVDAAGDVFVADSGGARVLELPAGGAQETLGFTGLTLPVGVAVDAAGDVFVSDFGSNLVQELPAAGPQRTLGFTGLDGLSGVAVDGAGDVFVANENGNQVLELTPSSVEKAVPFAGLDRPSGVAVDAAGDVFVANKGSNQVLKLTPGGTQTTLPFTGLNAPEGVAVDAAGNVFVANRGGNQVLKLTPGGTQTTLTFTGLNAPFGVAVDGAGNVFVSNAGSNQVLKLTPGGTQTTLAFTGLDAPEGVGVDPYGNVFVANNGSNQVFELTAGGLQQTLDLVQLDGPAGLGVDSVGSVFVANYNSNTVMVMPWVITNIYAAPSAVGTGSCNDAADACTLDTAVARANGDTCTLPGCPADTIYLAQAGTPGNPSTYYSGNWSLSNIFVTTPITIAAAPGLAGRPILDGGYDGVPILKIGQSTSVAVDGVTIQHGSRGIENNGVLTVTDSTLSGNGDANIIGGAIYNEGCVNARLTVSNSTFTGNSGGAGGAIGNGFGCSNVPEVGTVKVSGSTFTDNTSGMGGAIANGTFGASGTLTVTDSTFSRNSSTLGNGGPGGAIATGKGSATVANSTFTDNIAGGNGGAVDNVQSVTGSTFARNTGINGGAIYARSALTVGDSTFTDNQSLGTGGAIDSGDYGAAADLSVSDSVFTRNKATEDGGAIAHNDHYDVAQQDAVSFTRASSLTVSGSTFTGNSSGSYAGDGGAIDNSNRGASVSAVAVTNVSTITGLSTSTMTVSGSTFTGNSTTGNGGAINTGDHSGSATAEAVVTPTNTYAVTASNTTRNALTVTDSSFTSNSAAGGGAINNGDHGGGATATAITAPGVVFTATATNDITNALTISGSTFDRNSTAGDGGAVNNGNHGGNATTQGLAGFPDGNHTATVTNTNPLKLWNSTFSGNTAGRGGAIDNGDNGGNGTAANTSTVWDATFTGNAAPRGAVIDNGDAGSGTVYSAANIFNGSCLQGSGASSWVDAGYNAGSDATCENGGTGDSAALTSAQLGPLGLHGGPTQTVLPLSGPAIGIVPTPKSVTLNGNSVQLCPVTDQRGVASAPINCNAGAVQNNTVAVVAPTVSASHTANGANGWNTASPVTVNVSGLGGTSNLATLSCTVDGNAATLNPAFVAGSANYTGSITVSGEGVHPIACNATDTAGTAAIQATDSVKLDTVVTVSVSHTANGTNGWNTTSPVSVSVIGLDPTSKLATVSCTVDGSPTTLSPAFATGSAAYTGSISVSGEGVHPVTCNATDTAGNAAIPSTDSVKLDTVAPDTSILTHPASPTNSTGATFTFSGSDATSQVASFECKLDASSYTPCVSGHDFGIVAGGSHTLTVRAIDNAGSKDATPATFSWNVDLTEPNSSINTAGAGTPTNPTNSTSATFTFSATDSVSGGVASGVNHLECKLDSAAFATCTSTKTYTGLGIGAHTFQVRAVDNAGNVEGTPDSFAWQVHTATTMLYNGDQIVTLGSTFKPAGLLSSPTAGCVSGQPVTFSLDRNPTTGVAGTYSLGSANTNGSGQATLSSIATTHWLEGVYDITVSSAGSASCDTASYTASLTVAGTGSAAIGGGWYTTSATGRINFGFAVFKVPNTNPAQYKGQAVIQNNGKWRLRGTLNSYVKVATQGTASGVGDLYWWDSTLNRGSGGWHLAKSGVAFTMTFTDVRTGTNPTDTMGVNIKYTPVSPQPSTLPNSSPQPLKFGFVSVL